MKRGTVVLSPFPFTDLTGNKIRPAVVVSRSTRPGNDVLLAFMTSKKPQTLSPTDLLLPTTHPDFLLTGLRGSAIIKFDKLATLNDSLLLGELGELSPSLLQLANAKLRYALDL